MILLVYKVAAIILTKGRLDDLDATASKERPACVDVLIIGGVCNVRCNKFLWIIVTVITAEITE